MAALCSCGRPTVYCDGDHMLTFPGNKGTFFLGDDAQEFRKTATIRARQINDPFTVQTMEGDHAGKPGDWLAQGPAGELWVIARDIFEATYEPAGETE